MLCVKPLAVHQRDHWINDDVAPSSFPIIQYSVGTSFPISSSSSKGERKGCLLHCCRARRYRRRSTSWPSRGSGRVLIFPREKRELTRAKRNVCPSSPRFLLLFSLFWLFSSSLYYCPKLKTNGALLRIRQRVTLVRFVWTNNRGKVISVL